MYTREGMMKKTCSEDGWRRFLTLCSASSPKELEELFDLFFTLEEKEAVGKRYLILKALLDRKLTQREIAKVAHVSISKITRGSNALKVISSKMKEALQRDM